MVKSLNHPNVVKVHEAFYNEISETVFLVMDHIDGCSLKEHLERKGRLSHAESHEIFMQLIDAVEYIHSMEICHRDINPNNILISTDV